MLPSKFEGNPDAPSTSKTLFFFFIASSRSNAYFRAYAIINFLADRLVFLNTVTHALIGQSVLISSLFHFFHCKQ